MCGFCKMLVYVCLDFVKCGCVYICVGFLMCGSSYVWFFLKCGYVYL